MHGRHLLVAQQLLVQWQQVLARVALAHRLGEVRELQRRRAAHHGRLVVAQLLEAIAQLLARRRVAAQLLHRQGEETARGDARREPLHVLGEAEHDGQELRLGKG